LADGPDRYPLGERGLGAVRFGDDHPLQACLPGPFGHRQRTPYRPHTTVQAEFADQSPAVESARRDLPRRRCKRTGEGEIESRAGLSQVGRGEAGRDPAKREVVSRVLHRGSNPLPRLTYGGVRQADQAETGQATADVDLHLDRTDLSAIDREGNGPGEHDGEPKPDLFTGERKRSRDLFRR
jgi:hypothetical protein